MERSPNYCGFHCTRYFCCPNRVNFLKCRALNRRNVCPLPPQLTVEMFGLLLKLVVSAPVNSRIRRQLRLIHASHPLLHTCAISPDGSSCLLTFACKTSLEVPILTLQNTFSGFDISAAVIFRPHCLIRPNMHLTRLGPSLPSFQASIRFLIKSTALWIAITHLLLL